MTQMIENDLYFTQVSENLEEKRLLCRNLFCLNHTNIQIDEFRVLIRTERSPTRKGQEQETFCDQTVTHSSD